MGDLLHLGDVVAGRFRVDEQLTDAPHVFRGSDLSRGEPVALKTPNNPSPEAISALHHEFHLRTTVFHPGLAATHGLFVHRETPVLVQEWVSGSSVDAWAACEPDVRAAFRTIATGLLEALSALHSGGILHGDVKPEHLRMADGRLVLLDLDAGTDARRDAIQGLGGVVSGTPGYMAPELLRGAGISPASDFFAAGRTLQRLPGADGFPDLIESLTATEPSRRVAAATRFTGRRPVGRFVGRVQEIEVLEALGGSPGFSGIAVVGPAGIGKTTLVQRVLGEAARRGESVLHTRCHAAAAVPFEMLQGLREGLLDAHAVTPLPLGDLAGLLGLDTPGALSGETLEQAFVATVTALAERGPVHLWVDDWQWCDAESVPLVEALVAARPDGVRLVLTSRSTDVPTPTLPLSGLGVADAADLVQGSSAEPDAVDRWVADTAGSPLLLSHLAAGRTLEDVCSACLGPTAVALAAAVAPLDEPALSAVGPIHDGTLATLVSEGLVTREGADAWRISHDRVGEVLLELAPESLLNAVHGPLADHYATRPNARVQHAHHTLGAGRTAEGLPLAVALAREAQGKRAWGTAARWYDAAVSCVRDPDLLHERARAWTRAGVIDRALAAWRALEEETCRFEEARLRAAEVAFASGDVAGGQQLLAPLLETVALPTHNPARSLSWWMSTAVWATRLAWFPPAPRPPDARDRLRMRILWSIVGGTSGADGLLSATWVIRFNHAAHSHGEPLDRARARALEIAWSGTLTNDPERMHRLEKTIEEEYVPTEEGGWLAWGAGYGRFIGGHMASAEAWMQRALAAWNTAGVEGWERDHCTRHIGWSRRYQGDYEGMSISADACIIAGRATGNRVHQHEVRVGLRCFGHLVKGDLEAAIDEVTRDVGGWFGVQYLARHSQLAVALYALDVEAVEEAANRIWNHAWLLRQMQHVRIEVSMARLSAACIAADRSGVRRASRHLQRQLRNWGGAWACAALEVGRATHAWADGGSDAAAAYREAARHYTSLGMSVYADAACLHASLLEGGADPTEADAIRARFAERGVVDLPRFLNLLVPGPAARQGARWSDLIQRFRDHGL